MGPLLYIVYTFRENRGAPSSGNLGARAKIVGSRGPGPEAISTPAFYVLKLKFIVLREREKLGLKVLVGCKRFVLMHRISQYLQNQHLLKTCMLAKIIPFKILNTSSLHSAIQHRIWYILIHFYYK